MEIHADLDVLRENARAVDSLVDSEVTAIIKGVEGETAIAETMVEAGIGRLGVSHPAHLKRLAHLDVELLFVRIPRIAELPDVVAHADVSLHGSLEVIEAAAAAARRQDRLHRIVPMVDAGDGREGIAPKRLANQLGTIEGIEGVTVEALGINVGCFGDLPDLDAIRDGVGRIPERPLSVGGSVLLPRRDDLPESVRAFRVGDALLTGRWLDRPLEGLARGAFELQAEVLRAGNGESVIDIGSVSTDPRALKPREDIEIDRWSTELAVIDRELSPGDTVSFEMTYPAIARSFAGGHAEPIVHA